MQARLKSWWHMIWQRKWWFILLLIYKIIEDWGLGKLIGYVEEHRGIWVDISNFIINNLPWITWIAIPVTILILIVKAWLDSAKFQPVLATAQGQGYSPQVVKTLDTLIEAGGELTYRMQRDDFHIGQLRQDVGQWIDKLERDVWEMIPEYADSLTSNQVSGDDIYTDEEKMRYGGWNRDRGNTRISVDRRLARLRGIRFRIQGVGRGGS